MALIYDLADPQELQGFVRAAFGEEERNSFVLSQFLPNLNIDDIEYRIARGTLRDQDAAFVRSWDTESPIGNRQGVERILGELPPISKKIRLGEEERLRRRALERGSNTQLVDAIFDDAANMARAVAARIEMFRGEALHAGSLTINENGVNQTVPFGRAAGHTNVAPGILWSSTATATPIQDEQAWVTTYNDENGINPGVAITSTRVVNYLLLNAQYRSMAAQNGITPAFLSLNGLNQIRSTYDLPPIVKYDVKVRVNGTATRVIPDDKFIYVPPAGEPLGRTFFGTTAEALELVGANQINVDQSPGLVSVVEKTFDPVATWTKAAAVALPVLVNPNLSFSADVA
jgi:hypothetical protein